MKTQCTHCQAEVEIPAGYYNPFIKCPSCNKWTNAAPMATKPRDSEPQRSSQPPASISRPTAKSVITPIAPAGSGGAEGLPEMMKANKRLAGQICPACGNVINIGDPVHNCRNCGKPNHQSCWNSRNGCGNLDCAQSPGIFPDSASVMPGGMEQAQPGKPNLVPCRFCKEPIMKGARKCKHCQEYQLEEDRMALTAQPELDESEKNLTVGDWVVVVICPCAGCMGGIIWSLMGKPKGWKVVMYSVLSGIFWRTLSEIIGALSR